MKQLTTRKMVQWAVCAWLLLLSGGAVQAQSGPYGNEWIAPGQTYYKIKITRDALYRLDYAYLTKAGLSNGLDPSRLQLWRRGKELAVYQGGAPTTFDASTYLEFYGQRNDGVLDRDLYRANGDQPHQLYSFYTDTAAYFLTYPGPSGPQGRRMAESQSAGGGTPQAWWLYAPAQPIVNAYVEDPVGPNQVTFLPWLGSSEGFRSSTTPGAGNGNGIFDGVVGGLRAVPGTGPAPAPTIEVGLSGGTLVPHFTQVAVANPANPTVFRTLGTVTYSNYDNVTRRFALLRSDVGADGTVRIRCSVPVTSTSSSTRDAFRVSFLRAVVPQASRWFKGGPQFFRSDSTLSAPAAFEVDSIPATARGYDVHDPWNVQRIAPAAATALGALGRRFVFPSATAAQSRRLLLADAAAAEVPAAPRRLVFRALNARATFAIVTHPQVYGASKAPRLYAGYRASAAGGAYDTLVVTAPQLYDQFHYGERSWLALRHFSLWLVAGAPTNPNRYMLLLGKGIVPSESSYGGRLFRTAGEMGFDLIPTSSRAVSDNMISADFRAGDYRAKIRTGRLTVVNEQQVLTYLAKLKEHEALGLAPWRKNVLHLVAGTDKTETDDFRATMDRGKVRVEQPFFGGTVTTREVTSALPVPVNIATELNAGLSFITFFGHGSNNHFLLDFGTPADAGSGYTNAGKYPMLFLNGCAGNHTFTTGYTRVEDWLFNVPSAGALGSLGEYGFSYPDRLATSQDTIYRLMLNDARYYGQPVTAVHDEMVSRLQKLPSFKDDVGIEQLLGTGWQGDPALTLYAPAKPDFVASSAALAVASANPPTDVTAASASFLLNIGVSNPGKVTREPVEIRVTRSYVGTSRPDDVYTQVFRQAFRRDTVYAFPITNTVVNGVNVFGNNQFTVELDYQKKVAELDETNNTATLSYTFLQGGVTALNPPEFAIVPNRTPRLVAQTNDPNGAPRLFNVELDTTAAFNSPLVQRTDITAPLLVSWRPALPAIAGRDSVVWYWRVRFAAAAAGEDGRWATSSFRVIDGASGWSQSHYAQLQRNTLKGATVAGPNGRWAFDAQNTRATITSARIGPAQEWKTLLHQVTRANGSSSFRLRLLGIDANGVTKELNANVPSSRFSLAGISATEYPYLQLELSVADTNRVAPQLREWLVLYTGVPEGIVRRDLVPAATYAPAALLAQAAGNGKLAFPVQFENVSALPFGAPMRVKTEVFDSNTNTQVASVVQTVTAPLQPDAILVQNVEVPLTGKFGNLSTRVTFNPLPVAPTDPKALPELTHVNNELNLAPFQVGSTSVPPVLDVAFDGRHILNGEIVSPRPIVTLQLTDTDKLRPLADASAFTVYLQSGTGPATAVNVLGPDATFRVETTAAGSTAYLDYHPGRTTPLPDGTYTLRAQGRNTANLSAAAQEFQVKFTVVNASQITNVYPYPNPVTSKARFVFTVTGQELPRNMKIQIMTLTGRVVREIFMGELGNIHLGNNLTDFAWDGTDQYGDRLANGTYLYRVSLDDPDGKFSQRATSGDQAFKNDWGKLVLLR
ncbi:C25 family cysteine peptidase [Hymenobacter nivis]|nr:C25 family cysteine peptidase [Hymenobacter nivis]